MSDESNEWWIQWVMNPMSDESNEMGVQVGEWVQVRSKSNENDGFSETRIQWEGRSSEM